MSAVFGDVSGSAGFSIITVAQPDETRGFIQEGKMTQRVMFGLLLVGLLLSVPAAGQPPPSDRWHPSQTPDGQPDMQGIWRRSEEHTSELQSRPHLVCRLLLEKKKKNIHRLLRF